MLDTVKFLKKIKSTKPKIKIKMELKICLRKINEVNKKEWQNIKFQLTHVMGNLYLSLFCLASPKAFRLDYYYV